MSAATACFQEVLTSLGEWTAPTDSWGLVHKQLYLALAGVLAYKSVQVCPGAGGASAV